MLKPLSALMSLLLGLVSVSTTPTPSSAAKSASSQSKPTSYIVQLQKRIQYLQGQITGLKFQVEEQKIEAELPRQLHRGASGNDVKNLQEILQNMDGIYPEGLVTGYFGRKTELAVKKFQSASGLEALGIVDENTKSKLAEYQIRKTINEDQNNIASVSDSVDSTLPDDASNSANNFNQNNEQDNGLNPDPNTDNINVDIPNIPDQTVPTDSPMPPSLAAPTPTSAPAAPLLTNGPTTILTPAPTPIPAPTPKQKNKQ